MGSNSFFSSSQSTFSPVLSPNNSFYIFQSSNVLGRFKQYDYIKESLTKNKQQQQLQDTTDISAEQFPEQQEASTPQKQRQQDEEKETNFLTRHLIVYKLFYFLFYGAVGSLFPYLAVFYKQLYLSAQQVGVLIGVRPFIQMGTAPLWGALADSYNVKKIILLMSLGAWLGTNYSISFVRIPPSIACAVNDSIIRLPPPGRIVENINNLNTTVTQTGTSEEKGAKRGTSKAKKKEVVGLVNNTSELVRFIERYTRSLHRHTDHLLKLKTRSRRQEVTKVFYHDGKTTTNKNVRNVIVTADILNKNDMIGKVHMKNDSVSQLEVVVNKNRPNEYKNVTVARTSAKKNNITTISTSSNIPEVQRLLAADELEEEFDSFNTEGEYPWPLETIESNEQKELAKINATNIFVVLIIITIIGTIFASPTATLADTATLENLNKNLHQYGFQRVWGALGWGLGAFVVGLIVSYIQRIDCQRGNHVDYILSFYVYAVMMAFAFLCAVFFKFSPVQNDSPYSESLGEAIKMFCDCQHISFVVTLLISGASLGFIHTFLFWHLHDLGGNQTLFSVLTAVQCISEVLIYFLSGYLIVIAGYDNVLYIGLASNVIRLFAYSVISKPLYSIPMEILQGISSASIWTSAICYIGLIPGAPVTLQALLHGIYWGLGHGGGGILGGVMVTYFGSTVTFVIYGTLCLVNLIFLLLLKYRSKLMELMGNYTYVENIPAGTYILTTMAQERSDDSGSRASP